MFPSSPSRISSKGQKYFSRSSYGWPLAPLPKRGRDDRGAVSFVNGFQQAVNNKVFIQELGLYHHSSKT